MLMQDTLTGYVHEAPEFGYAQAPDAYGQVDYSGYGGPFGFLKFVNPFAGRRRRRRAAAAPAEPPPAPMPGPEMPPPDMPAEPGAGEVAYDGFGNPVGLVNVLPPFLRFTPPGLRFTPPNLRITPPRVVWSPILRRFVRWVFSPTQRRWVQLPAAAPGAPAPAYPGAPIRRRWPLGWIRPSLPYTGLGPNRMYMRCAVWPGPKGLVPALAAQMMPGGAGGAGRRRRRRRRR